ncbi:MAG: CvpA family protein [Ruminococcaceae bacterium]|nr:CvpA family protein [Oscillospiraceae bacterium]
MGANVIIDIVLAVIALLVILKFTVRGFLRSVLDTLKVFIAGFVAYLLRLSVGKIFDGWFMNKSIVGWVRNSLLATAEGGDAIVDFADLYNSVPEFFNTVLTYFGLGDVSKLESIGSASSEDIEALAVDIGSSISSMLSMVLAIVAVFIVAIIVLTIVIKLLDNLTNFTAVKVVNRILGFALGVAFAGLILFAVSYALNFLVGVTNGFGGRLPQEVLDQSMVVNLMKLIIF